MPPWGRPPGGQGRRRGEWERPAEGVYRFQELDSDEDGLHGVTSDSSMQKGRHPFNPDQLYFNDMDPRAWEQMVAERDGLAYGDTYESPEEDDYLEEGGGAIVHLAPFDQEEVLFKRVLDKIRRARGSGKPNVALTQEELEAYEARTLRNQQAPAPAARPPAQVKTSGALPSSANSSTRSKRESRRSSIFSSPKSAKSKSSGKKRAPSVSEPAPVAAPPPGFIIPGPDGQPMYAPITYNPRHPRSTSSPSRPGSRSASMNSRNGNQPTTPPREAPGAFPTDSPTQYRSSTPPFPQPRQSSYPTRQGSHPEDADWAEPKRSRSGSSSNHHQLPLQPPPQLVPFPVTPYQHYHAEPYTYHLPQSAPSTVPSSVQPQTQPQVAPQYTQSRHIVSGPPDGYINMPRRVPVPAPAQRASVHGAQGMQSSYPDSAIGYKASGLRDELSDDDDDDGQHGVLVDVVQEAGADQGYNVNIIKSGGSSGGAAGNSGGGAERRRRGRRK